MQNLCKMIWLTTNLQQLILKKIPVLDVRASVEFNGGSLPNSLNIPILDDHERTQVGTVYKQQGREAAIALGYEIVNGINRENKIQKWKEFFHRYPEGIITCFRGGLRSKTTQEWLAEIGILRPRLEGGYKAGRNFLLQELNRISKTISMRVISGATGSGKTLLLRQIENQVSVIDLEEMARHRGSAFGGFGKTQPSQVDFENRLSSSLIQLESKVSLVEDESRLIGRCVQPESFFLNLRQSPIVMIEENLESRVETTFQEYILESPIGCSVSELGVQTYERYREALLAISKKLGGLL